MPEAGTAVQRLARLLERRDARVFVPPRQEGRQLIFVGRAVDQPQLLGLAGGQRRVVDGRTRLLFADAAAAADGRDQLRVPTVQQPFELLAVSGADLGALQIVVGRLPRRHLDHLCLDTDFAQRVGQKRRLDAQAQHHPVGERRNKDAVRGRGHHIFGIAARLQKDDDLLRVGLRRKLLAPAAEAVEKIGERLRLGQTDLRALDQEERAANIGIGRDPPQRIVQGFDAQRRTAQRPQRETPGARRRPFRQRAGKFKQRVIGASAFGQAAQPIGERADAHLPQQRDAPQRSNNVCADPAHEAPLPIYVARRRGACRAARKRYYTQPYRFGQMEARRAQWIDL